jgi:hypothetical protein
MGAQEAKPVEVTLTRPVQHEGQTYEVLTFDELTMGDEIDFEVMRDGFSKPPTAEQAASVTIFLMARCADVPEAVIRKIRASDHGAVHAAFNTVLPPAKAGKAGNGKAA